jgi:hypothetical protein
VILYKGGYATTLGTWVGDPSNLNDFALRLLCNGTSIKVFVDGTERLSVTDASHASGKVGFGTFASSTTLFTDLIVDDGTSAATPSEHTIYLRQMLKLRLRPNMSLMPFLVPSSLPALPSNSDFSRRLNKTTFQRVESIAVVTRTARGTRTPTPVARVMPTATRTPSR